NHPTQCEVVTAVRDGLLSLEQACNRFLLGRRISCQYSVGWHGLRACALHASRKYRPRSPGLYPPMQVTLAVRRRMVLSQVGAAALPRAAATTAPHARSPPAPPPGAPPPGGRRPPPRLPRHPPPRAPCGPR